MCAMFMCRKKPGKNERIVTRRVGVKDKSGYCYITCSWLVEYGGRRQQISFSRDNMCVYIEGQPIQTQIMLDDQDYDVHIWWEDESDGTKYRIFSDVDVSKRDKPMVNYLFINDEMVSSKQYKEHKKEKVPEQLKRPIDIYLQECEQYSSS